MSLDIPRHSPIVLLSQKRKAREAVLELDIATQNTDECVGNRKIEKIKLN